MTKRNRPESVKTEREMPGHPAIKKVELTPVAQIESEPEASQTND